jgi:PAS domain S-box-containing protein
MPDNYILYVDDDKINLELFKGLLDDTFNILTESSTSRAFDLLETHTVKVIVSDQRMPEESGLSFLERVHQKYPSIIKIIYTAFLDHDAALRAVNQGTIYRYLMKPWNSEQMRITLDSALLEFDLRAENRKLLDELTKKNIELETAFNQIIENELKLINIFKNSNDGIVILQDGIIKEANPAFLNILEAKFEDDLTAINNVVKEKFAYLFSKSFLKIAQQKTHSISEIELVLSAKKKKYIELNSKIIVYSGSDAVLSIIRDITERKEHDQKILEAVVQTQEEEQGKYARELHDGLGPILSTLKMYVEWLADPKNTENKEQISKQTIVSIDGAINLVKEIANNLSPHILQRFGLINAIQTYLDQVKVNLAMDCIVSSNLNNRLAPNIEVPLYRVLMECINNSLKHANAKKILIKFKITENNLTITYSDNGQGFDVHDVMSKGKGMGLFNIQNRIRLLGGDMKLISNTGVGTDVEIALTI